MRGRRESPEGPHHHGSGLAPPPVWSQRSPRSDAEAPSRGHVPDKREKRVSRSEARWLLAKPSRRPGWAAKRLWSTPEGTSREIARRAFRQRTWTSPRFAEQLCDACAVWAETHAARVTPASRGRRRAGSMPSSRHSRRCKLESSPVRPHGFPRLRNGWRPSSMGFGALRRLRKRVATCAGFASPDYAAPLGFLNLLTLSSTRNLSGLVSCR